MVPVPASALSAHAAGVERLLASYRSIPATAAVRLAKPTSNLFRARAKRDAPGLDISGLTNVIGVDPDARTADVAGMCTYEDLVAATLPYGLSPLVVPQLKTITLGGAVTGLGIESASFRNGLPHESVLEMDILTGTGELLTASPPPALRPLPRVSEFVWHTGIFDTTAHRARTCQTVRRAAARAIPLADRPDGGDGPHHRHRWAGWRSGRLSRRRGVQRRRELPVSRWTHHDPRTGQRLHRTRTSTTAPSSTTPPPHQRRPVDHARLLLALGHRLVLVLTCFRRAEPASATLVAATLPPQQRLLEAGRPRPAVRYRRPHRKAQWPSAARTGGPGRRGADRTSDEFLEWFLRQRADRHRSGCARCGFAITTAGRCIRSGRTTPTSTSASGRRCRRAPPMARRTE